MASQGEEPSVQPWGVHHICPSSDTGSHDGQFEGHVPDTSGFGNP